jgi:hypothetical protein
MIAFILSFIFRALAKSEKLQGQEKHSTSIGSGPGGIGPGGVGIMSPVPGGGVGPSKSFSVGI